jgi:hypothetical protein
MSSLTNPVHSSAIRGRFFGFPDKFTEAELLSDGYAALRDHDSASDWYERAYRRRDPEFFTATSKAINARYRVISARWKALTQQPLFKSWQAEHDRSPLSLR